MQTAVRTLRQQNPHLLTAPPDAYQRLAYIATFILAITGIFTCCCDTPMIWDGSYQFALTLIREHPYFYLTRFHSYFFWLPTVWLSHFTDNLTALKITYGLPFTLAPAFGVLMSWWVVRERAPYLILWVIFGVAAGPLPGQIFIINDSIVQQHLFWPVFVAMLTRVRWPQTIGLSFLVVFQFSHQIGALLLAGGAGAALLLAALDRRARRESIIKGGLLTFLAIVAAWKIIHFPDSWAQQEFTAERMKLEWQYGVDGYPLHGIALMTIGASAFMLHRIRSRKEADPFQQLLKWVATLCIVAAAINWTFWASNSGRWSTAVNYRRFVVPMTIPFYLLAFVDRIRAIRTPDVEQRSSRLGLTIGSLVAATFALIIGIQSITWARLTSRMLHDVEAWPKAAVPWQQIAWTRDTPLYHWGTTSYVFVLEGRKPRRLLLDASDTIAAGQLELTNETPPVIPLSPFTPVSPMPGPGGWFDFRPLLHSLHHGE